jgi:hypothetical protein
MAWTKRVDGKVMVYIDETADPTGRERHGLGERRLCTGEGGRGCTRILGGS